MSADNYMALRQDEDGDWHAWMVLGGYEDEDWEIPEDPGHFHFVGDKEDALDYAIHVCENEIVEYGIRIIK